ncbi:hypothetical protein N7470_000922 [Penicillium chermesinum]|nr:hypothetical protein N7470_000922 [Penicillium chermesinum]
MGNEDQSSQPKELRAHLENNSSDFFDSSPGHGGILGLEYLEHIDSSSREGGYAQSNGHQRLSTPRAATVVLAARFHISRFGPRRTRSFYAGFHLAASVHVEERRLLVGLDWPSQGFRR